MKITDIIMKYRNRLSMEELGIVELALRGDVDVDDPQLCRELIPKVNRVMQKIDPDDVELRKALEGFRQWLEMCVICGIEDPENPRCMELIDTMDPYDE